jgi:hypothetical protein
VRRAAARSLSGILGIEVGHVATLSDEERRREVRRLANVPPVPLAQRARTIQRAAPAPLPQEPEPESVDELGTIGTVEDSAPAHIEVSLPPTPREPGELHADEALCVQISSELRTSMRGRTVQDLATQLGVTDERVIEAAALLTARGQVIRRGAKLFVA